MSEFLGVASGEQTEGRNGYRAGDYGRNRIGKLEMRVPRLACSSIALECRLERRLELDEIRSGLLITEVLVFHVDEALLDGNRGAMDRFHPIARLDVPDYATLGRIIIQPKVSEAGATEHR